MNISQALLSWGMVACYVILNSAGALIIKHKVVQMGEVSFDNFGSAFRYFLYLFTSFEVIAGFAAIFLSAIAWIAALSKMELSVAYPVAIGFNFLIILTFSFLLHGEQFTLNKMIGIALIMLSLFFLYKV